MDLVNPVDNLKALPSWLLLVLAAYLAILVSYAVYDGRRVDLWPPTIHAKGDDVVPLEEDQKYATLLKKLDASEKERTDLRDAKSAAEQDNAKLLSRVDDLEKELQQEKQKMFNRMESKPSEESGKLSKRYYNEQDKGQSKPLVITHLSDVIYRLEDHGDWPWDGTAILDGNMLYGIAKLKKSERIIVINGHLRDDGSIKAELVFVIRENGKYYPIPGAEGRGRVDPHTWYPER